MSPTPTNYTQGYSSSTTSTHASRTAQSDASFLLPYLHANPASHILDIGCGPGTITTGLAALVPQGSVTGVELSDEILSQAQRTVDSANEGSGVKNIVLVKADVLQGLFFSENTFDVVFASQLFPHLPGKENKIKALTEMRRVLKPGGILATRDAVELHFYPKRYGLDGLWAGNMKMVLSGGSEDSEEGGFPGGRMKGLYRSVGFSEVQVGAGTTVYSSESEKKWFVEGCVARLSEGDTYRESWAKATWGCNPREPGDGAVREPRRDVRVSVAGVGVKKVGTVKLELDRERGSPTSDLP